MFKTKSKKMFVKSFVATKVFLSIFFLGSSVFASGFSMAEKVDLDQSAQKQDLSVFVDRLSTRLKGVFGEIVGLSQGIVDKNGSSNTDVKSNSNINDVQNGFIDISNSKYKNSIEKLVEMGVVNPNRSKFYPDNYLRRYEMVIMMVKYSLAKKGENSPQVLFSNRGWFSDVGQNASYAPYLAYAEQNNMIDQFISRKDQKKIFSPNSFVYNDEICSVLNLTCDNNDEREKLTRGEFVELLVSDDVDTDNESDKTIVNDTGKADSLIGALGNMFAIVR